jgi:hypothetical protein
MSEVLVPKNTQNVAGTVPKPHPVAFYLTEMQATDVAFSDE